MLNSVLSTPAQGTRDHLMAVLPRTKVWVTCVWVTCVCVCACVCAFVCVCVCVCVEVAAFAGHIVRYR